jgi:L-ribulose-5-phosphate 3-epimerase
MNNKNEQKKAARIPYIGVMQGRLLPKYMGRYQAHPVGYWQNEFKLAKSYGLNGIEWILDWNDWERNPLLSETGLHEVLQHMKTYNQNVRSICADCFMQNPLHSEDEQVANAAEKLFLKCIEGAKTLGTNYIVIPLVEVSSIQDKKNESRFKKCLLKLLPIAEKNGITLALETDLNPERFSEILNEFESPCLAVNYDIGNSASLGYRVDEEFEAYGKRIVDIHIKDRILGGGSVFLGTGNANFEEFFKQIRKVQYNGIFVYQAFRDDEGLEILKRQIEWFTPKLNEAFQK